MISCRRSSQTEDPDGTDDSSSTQADMENTQGNSAQSGTPSQVGDLAQEAVDAQESLMPQAEPPSEDMGMVIDMTHSEELAWDSGAESTSTDISETSTPAYKRGAQPKSEIGIQHILDEIIQDSKVFCQCPKPHRASLHLLTDAQMDNCPPPAPRTMSAWLTIGRTGPFSSG